MFQDGGRSIPKLHDSLELESGARNETAIFSSTDTSSTIQKQFRPDPLRVRISSNVDKQIKETRALC